MNTIPIDLIAPSPNPVRKTWDEGKMEELAQSIAERGVIVAIKVRPNDIKPCRWGNSIDHGFDALTVDGVHYLNDNDSSGELCEGCTTLMDEVYGDDYFEFDELPKPKHIPFEVVYGHRRIEAARRAGLAEMPAIIENVDDTDVLIQALIENVQREDMSVKDRAIAARQLMDELELNQHQIVKGGYVPSTVEDWLLWLKEYEAGAISGSRNDPGIRQAREIRTVLKDDIKAKRAVSDKAAKDNLDWRDTRAVADAYKAADTPELKQKVLETSGKLGDSDSILMTARMKVGGDASIERHENERRKAFEEYDQAVKDFVDAVSLFDRMIKTARNASRYGKFSPEGARFTVRKIDRLINELEELKGVLENVD